VGLEFELRASAFAKQALYCLSHASFLILKMRKLRYKKLNCLIKLIQ
jgi:hypothetical protein